MHERVQLCQDPQTEFALLRESFGVSRINQTLRAHGHTILQERDAAKIFDEVGERSLERLFPGFTGDSSEQAAHSAHQVWVTKGPLMLPAGALIAAKPRILDMIRGATTAGLLPEQPLLASMSAELKSATATFLDVFDDAERPTAWLYLQKAAQAADESWQQTVQGYIGPTVTNPTVPEIEQGGSPSQDDDDDHEPTFAPPRKSRLSAPQLQATATLKTHRRSVATGNKD